MSKLHIELWDKVFLKQHERNIEAAEDEKALAYAGVQAELSPTYDSLSESDKKLWIRSMLKEYKISKV